jgi:hypothetical protein
LVATYILNPNKLVSFRNSLFSDKNELALFEVGLDKLLGITYDGMIASKILFKKIHKKMENSKDIYMNSIVLSFGHYYHN